MSKQDIDVIDDPDMLLDEVDAGIDVPDAELDESMVTPTEMSAGEVEAVSYTHLTLPTKA